MRHTLPLALCVTAALGCNGPPATPRSQTPTGFAQSYGVWTPGPRDDCTAEIHNSYSVVGPDGKLYPTWHPPVDPATGCSFGHDHGRDPRGSALYATIGPIPFGYANEQLDVYDPANPRHEDHFGHKIEWENGVQMHFGSPAADALFDIRCDVLTKLHQGTHSKDAFTNNLHELAYHIWCSDGTGLHLTILAAIGDPGGFTRSCDGTTEVAVGPPTPANSPAGGGRRLIPDRVCVDQHVLVAPGQRSDFGALHESWQTSNSIEREEGEECDQSTANGTIVGVTFDDPRSVFNGVDRVVDVNANVVDNADGPELWYTDPFGKHGRTAPFPGSIQQFISRINNTRGGLNASGPGIGQDRSYGGPRVHSPN